MKVLLIQQPVPSFTLDTRLTNPSLAAGYLKAMAHKEGLLKRVDIEIMDKGSADLKGEADLVDTIVSKSPDLLGFSCYSWNIIRSLYIAGKVKTKLPNLKVIIGGPEVTSDNPIVLTNPHIDIMVFGEGEGAFVELLKHFLDGKPQLCQIKGIAFRENDELVFTPPRDPIPHLDKIPSPYQLNFLNPAKDRYMAIETMRGCPYRCKYCYYHKNFPTIRTFSLERIEKDLILAKKLGVKEVYIMDPSFNIRARFGELCRLIKRVNADKSIVFHTELRADLVDREKIELLDECNIKILEVGLQSTNPIALANVGRENDLQRFRENVLLLKELGFSVRVGIIIGLPGDTPATIGKTIEFLLGSGIKTDVEVFKLSILPGTTLRVEAGKFGLEFQSEPPYYVLKTERLSCQDIQNATKICEETFDEFNSWVDPDAAFPLMATYSSGRYPRLTRGEAVQNPEFLEVERPVTKIILDLDARSQTAEEINQLARGLGGKVASCFTVWFKCSKPQAEVGLMRAFLEPISLANPYLVWNIILETRVPFPANMFEEVKESIFYRKHYLDNAHCFRSKNPNSPRHATRLFLVLSLDDGTFSEGWLEEIGRRALIFWATELVDGENVKKKLDNLYKKAGAGLLIDFHPNSNADFILNTLELLRTKNTVGKSIRFENWVLQRLWNVKFKEKTKLFGMDEFILNFDKELRVTSTIFQENELMLDMAEWVLSTRKSQEAMS